MSERIVPKFCGPSASGSAGCGQYRQYPGEKLFACTSYATQIDFRFGDAVGNCLHFGIGV